MVAAIATPAPMTTICPRWLVNGVPTWPLVSSYTSVVGFGTPTGVVWSVVSFHQYTAPVSWSRTRVHWASCLTGVRGASLREMARPGSGAPLRPLRLLPASARAAEPEGNPPRAPSPPNLRPVRVIAATAAAAIRPHRPEVPRLPLPKPSPGLRSDNLPQPGLLEEDPGGGGGGGKAPDSLCRGNPLLPVAAAGGDDRRCVVVRLAIHAISAYHGESLAARPPRPRLKPSPPPLPYRPRPPPTPPCRGRPRPHRCRGGGRGGGLVGGADSYSQMRSGGYPGCLISKERN